jgi:hypothetical protein
MTEEGASSESERTVAFLLSLRARGVRDITLLRAMERVPREHFAPSRFADLARQDVSVPLPCGQTMTAPHTVAALVGALEMKPDCRVLEIGSGSGYVAALLAAMGGRSSRSSATARSRSPRMSGSPAAASRNSSNCAMPMASSLIAHSAVSSASWSTA